VLVARRSKFQRPDSGSSIVKSVAAEFDVDLVADDATGTAIAQMVANGSAASRSPVQCQTVYPNRDKTEIWSFTLISELRSGCKARPSS
jgi:hypothetical protein